MVDKDFDRVIAEYYREMELDIIASMKRNLSRHVNEESDYEFDFPQWQAVKLKELKRYQRENERIVAGVSNRVSKDVTKHMLDELSQGSKSEMKRFKEIMGDKYDSSVIMKDSFFRINDSKVNSLISALKGDLYNANYAALRMANDTYRDVIFKASLFAANGVKTPKQAIDMATRDFLSRGINCIEYKNGRRVNIASYAQMAVRTASQRAYLIGEGKRRQEIGVPFVKITAHNTSCALCRPFERKILIDDVYSGGKPSDGNYMLMSTAMAQGLFHPNCRHGTSTHYPELDDFEYEPESTDNQYEEDTSDKEKQAHIEQMIQKYKRLVNGSLDPDNIAFYQTKLDEWEEKKLKENAHEFVPQSVEILDKSDIIESIQQPLSGSDLFSEKAKQQLYRDERIISGNNYETALVYDKDGNRIFRKKGKADSVGFTSSEIRKMKNCVVTHNHPKGSGFSAEDILSLRSTHATEMRACTNNGVFIIRQPTTWPVELKNLKTMKKAIIEVYDDVGMQYREIAAREGESIYKYLNQIEIRTFEEFSKKYGFEFKWEAK